MVVPGDWTVLPLDPTTRDRRIAGIVRRRIGNEDKHAYLRRQYTMQLRKAAADAAARGAFFSAVHNSQVQGMPLCASVMAALLPEATDPAGVVLHDPEAMAATVAEGDRGGGEGTAQVLERSVVDLQVGRAARIRRRAGSGIRAQDGREVLAESVHYYVPLPEVRRVLGLIYSTPLLSLADVYTELFDVMALTATWLRAPLEASR